VLGLAFAVPAQAEIIDTLARVQTATAARGDVTEAVANEARPRHVYGWIA